ncbi:MAG TPA: LPS export ABC transporter periplasmic protein LptC [Gallionella sp.]|nr:LPS export ABC transporter periplasmic protein LptC [Gallionella sp.]
MTFYSRARYWLPLLPLLGILGVTYWLDQQTHLEPETAGGGMRHDPDAIMENFSSVKMNDQGVPRFIMSAKKMQHYPDDDSSALEAPRMASLSATLPTVHLVAQRGIVSGSGNEVFLHDEVEVLREASATRGELTLQTDYLRVVPDRDWADTDHAVTIFDERNVVHAVGLEMDNKARTLKLLSQVRSVHEPR